MAVKQESLQGSSTFSERLGKALTTWAVSHPQADERIMQFFGTSNEGTIGKLPSLTPRQYAQEITEQTPFGISRTMTYLRISENLGDPTGERVIHDLSEASQKPRG